MYYVRHTLSQWKPFPVKIHSFNLLDFKHLPNGTPHIIVINFFSNKWSKEKKKVLKDTKVTKTVQSPPLNFFCSPHSLGGSLPQWMNCIMITLSLIQYRRKQGCCWGKQKSFILYKMHQWIIAFFNTKMWDHSWFKVTNWIIFIWFNWV